MMPRRPRGEKWQGGDGRTNAVKWGGHLWVRGWAGSGGGGTGDGASVILPTARSLSVYTQGQATRRHRHTTEDGGEGGTGVGKKVVVKSLLVKAAQGRGGTYPPASGLSFPRPSSAHPRRRKDRGGAGAALFQSGTTSHRASVKPARRRCGLAWRLEDASRVCSSCRRGGTR